MAARAGPGRGRHVSDNETVREDHAMRKDEEDPKTTQEESIVKRPVSRREFLKYAGVAGAIVGAGGGLGGLLAACGDDETTTTTAGGETTTTAAG